MNPVQYILINKGAAMSAGKMAAQAAHASVEGVRLSARGPNGNPWDASLVNRWYQGGHYAKIVLEVADAQALLVAKEYISSRGFKCALIIDEGRTEIEPMTSTALGCEVVDKDWPHARETFSVFKLYTDEKPAPNVIWTMPAAPPPAPVWSPPLFGTPIRYITPPTITCSLGTDPNPEPRSEDGDVTRLQDRDT